MTFLNRIWYTLLSLLIIATVFAMFSPRLATGSFLLWPTVFASAVVGGVVGRKGAVAAGIAGALFLGPIVMPLPRVCFVAPLPWGEQLVEDLSSVGVSGLGGASVSLVIWTIWALVSPRRSHDGASQISGSSIEVHPVTGVVTERTLVND